MMFLVLAMQVPVDWCRRSNPCQNGGRCRAKDGSFTCDCVGSWSGRYCDIPGVSCEVAALQRGTSVSLTCCRYFNTFLTFTADFYIPSFSTYRPSDGWSLRSRRSLCKHREYALLQVSTWLHRQLLRESGGPLWGQTLPQRCHLQGLRGRIHVWCEWHDQIVCAWWNTTC